MNIIDPHLHLFDLIKGDYHWLKSDKPPFWPNKKAINRSFNQSDLSLKLPMNLAGFVHIEAGFDNTNPENEIAWLEATVSMPFKSVAFADLTAVDFQARIARLKQYHSVIGIRHILDEEASSLLSSPQVISNLAYLAESKLLFEAQFNVSDDEASDRLLAIMTRHPTLRVVIEHAGLPTPDTLKSWHDNMLKFGQLEQCFVKLSGWEMHDWNFDKPFIAKVTQHILSLFPEIRVMFASNFPVINLVENYDALWSFYTRQLKLTQHQINQLCYQTAKQCYQL